MATSSRAFVPSAALLRALARPQPLRCPLARALPAQFVRGKKSKAAKARDLEKVKQAKAERQQRRLDRDTKQGFTDFVAEEAATIEANKNAAPEEETDEWRKKQVDKALAELESPTPNAASATKKMLRFVNVLHDDRLKETLFERFSEPDADPEIPPEHDHDFKIIKRDPLTGEIYEVEALGTVEDRRRRRKIWEMNKEAETNPDVDEAEITKLVIDDLIASPEFPDLRENMQEVRDNILTKAEIKQAQQESEVLNAPKVKEFDAFMRSHMHRAVTDLLNDPDIGPAKPLLQELADRWDELDDIHSPEFQRLYQAASAKVHENPTIVAKLQAGSENETDEEKKRWADYERNVKEIEELMDPDTAAPMTNDEINELMRETLAELDDVDMDPALKARMAEFLSTPLVDPLENEDEEEDDREPTYTDEEAQYDLEQESYLANLAADLKDWADSRGKPLSQLGTPDEDFAEENISPEQRAKVDAIMDDPRLMERFLEIQRLIAENLPDDYDPNDITLIDHPTAPDPYEQDPSKLTTLAARMAEDRHKPEHSAALARLRVTLQPPFSVHPALRAFNEAMEYAYFGANDDIRRILWRCYQKARTLPTFLINIPDGTWDILYYSQAVKWKGNQNRRDHLKMLIADLKKVGKDGPPTHPSMIGKKEEAQQLEDVQEEAAAERHEARLQREQERKAQRDEQREKDRIERLEKKKLRGKQGSALVKEVMDLRARAQARAEATKRLQDETRLREAAARDVD